MTDPAEDPTDAIGAEGSMQYLEQLGVNLDDASMFLALQVLKAENIGELTKDGFVKGWKEAGYVALSAPAMSFAFRKSMDADSGAGWMQTLLLRKATLQIK